ncbi:SoxR reducing system RseC family protein [Thalassotalea euphylliae]|uniref:Transcriptional regulator n=1 Tax=Thalassotalea euphylliae TaxID=1655234 RepID=A0A3E0U0Q1_9GAMM|nr:SoxR reducing system RseC family protein [Thalassotalea euphylliae]REL30551.1 transcriptional regulator [Thalassotalea euphylliae]
MDEKATIVEVSNHSVVVESQVKSTCNQCQQVDNCGSGLVAKALPQQKLRVEIVTQEQFTVGEQVIISIPEQAMLAVAWQVYLWPVIGLMLGAGLGQVLLLNGILSHELPTIMMGFVGGYAGFKWAKARLDNNPKQQALVPTIKQRLIPTLATPIS